MEVLASGGSYPVANVTKPSPSNLPDASSTELVLYQYEGKLKVASADAASSTSGKNGEAVYWINSQLAPPSVFDQHYASKTKCLSDPQHRGNIYFDTVDLDDTLGTYTQPLWVLTGFEIFFALFIVYKLIERAFDLDNGQHALMLKYAEATAVKPTSTTFSE